VLDRVAFQIPLVCPDPYLKGEEMVLETTATSGLEYPIAFEPQIIMDQVNLEADSQTFYTVNDGDHPVGFLFDYAAFSGGDLVLSVGSDEMVIADLSPGDRLLIDTSRRTILINGGNGFANLASGGFPRLPIGDVIIDIAGTVGRSTLTFTPVFEGV
jgi:hypothetical protein